MAQSMMADFAETVLRPAAKLADDTGEVSEKLLSLYGTPVSYRRRRRAGKSGWMALRRRC